MVNCSIVDGMCRLGDWYRVIETLGCLLEKLLPSVDPTVSLELSFGGDSARAESLCRALRLSLLRMREPSANPLHLTDDVPPKVSLSKNPNSLPKDVVQVSLMSKDLSRHTFTGLL